MISVWSSRCNTVLKIGYPKRKTQARPGSANAVYNRVRNVDGADSDEIERVFPSIHGSNWRLLRLRYPPSYHTTITFNLPPPSGYLRRQATSTEQIPSLPAQTGAIRCLSYQNRVQTKKKYDSIILNWKSLHNIRIFLIDSFFNISWNIQLFNLKYKILLQ